MFITKEIIIACLCLLKIVIIVYLFVMKTRGLFYPNEEQTNNTIYMTLFKTIISIILFYMPVTDMFCDIYYEYTHHVLSCYCIVSCNSFFFVRLLIFILRATL